MLKMVIDLLLLTTIIVYITDMSGVVPNIKAGLARLLTKGRFKSGNYSLHIIDCSRCQTWWFGLLLIIIEGQFNLPAIAAVAAFSWFGQKVIRDIMTIIEYYWDKITSKILRLWK